MWSEIYSIFHWKLQLLCLYHAWNESMSHLIIYKSLALHAALRHVILEIVKFVHSRNFCYTAYPKVKNNTMDSGLSQIKAHQK